MAKQKTASSVGKSNVRKGKTLERRVANLFSEWTGETFRRRKVEGRDQTIIERDSTADIIAVSRVPIFSIEVKSGSGTSMDALLSNPQKTKLTQWWHQSTYDANLLTESLKKTIYPFLFFKPIPAWDWVMFPTEIVSKQILKSIKPFCNNGEIWFSAFKYEGYSQIGEVVANVSQSKKNPVWVGLQLPPAYICRWQDFRENVDPKSIFYDTNPPEAVLS